MKVYLRLLRYTLAHRGRLFACIGAAVLVGILNTATFATGLPFFKVLFGEEGTGSKATDVWAHRVIEWIRGFAGSSKASMLLAFLSIFVVLTTMKALAPPSMSPAGTAPAPSSSSGRRRSRGTRAAWRPSTSPRTRGSIR